MTDWGLFCPFQRTQKDVTASWKRNFKSLLKYRPQDLPSLSNDGRWPWCTYPKPDEFHCDSKVKYDNYGGRVGLLVRALAFHQCGLGSVSALGVKCGLSCWFSTLPWDVFPRVLQFSPLIKNQHLIWFDLWIMIVKIMIWAMLIWFPLEL